LASTPTSNWPDKPATNSTVTEHSGEPLQFSVPFFKAVRFCENTPQLKAEIPFGSRTVMLITMLSPTE